MRKALSVAMVIALLLCSFQVFAGGAGESSSDDGVTTIRVAWWGGDARHKAMLDMIAAFEAENPDIKVEPEYSAFAQYGDKFFIQLTSGAAPDVMAVDQPWCATAVQQGDFFLDLSPYAEQLQIDTFDDYLIDNYSYFNDKLLFLPIGINGMGSLVDTEILSQFGFDINDKDFTWDDMFALAEKVHAANPDWYLCCTDSKQAALYYARVYLRQLTGRQLINDDGTMGCTREELAEALELVDRCYKENVFQPITISAVYNNTMTQNPDWLNRKMFMILGRTSVMTETASRREIDGHYTTTGYVMPQLEGGVESGIEVRPVTLYAVNKETRNPDAAVRFLEFMFTTEAAAKAIGSNYSVPAREESRGYVADVLDPSAIENVEYSLANAGSTLNAWSGNSEVEALFTEIMEKIAYGQYDSMLEAADEIIERIGMIVTN